MDKKNKKKIIKIIVFALEFFAIAIVVYIFILPIYPVLKYKFIQKEIKAEIQDMQGVSIEEIYQDEEIVKKKTREFINRLPRNEYAISPNRVIIPKIGVNAPIVEAKSAEYGLSLGIWRVPESSTPDKGGNTVLTGHRFKYLPPNNLTFYLFHELVVGDLVSVVYKEKDYLYRIREIKIVEPTEISIMDPTSKPVLTLFTCHPIYSTDKRLVVVADLVVDTQMIADE